MDLPETLALPRAKQESQHLQPGRVNLVPSERPRRLTGDDRSLGKQQRAGRSA